MRRPFLLHKSIEQIVVWGIYKLTYTSYILAFYVSSDLYGLIQISRESHFWGKDLLVINHAPFFLESLAPFDLLKLLKIVDCQ